MTKKTLQIGPRPPALRTLHGLGDAPNPDGSDPKQEQTSDKVTFFFELGDDFSRHSGFVELEKDQTTDTEGPPLDLLWHGIPLLRDVVPRALKTAHDLGVPLLVYPPPLPPGINDERFVFVRDAILTAIPQCPQGSIPWLSLRLALAYLLALVDTARGDELQAVFHWMLVGSAASEIHIRWQSEAPAAVGRSLRRAQKEGAATRRRMKGPGCDRRFKEMKRLIEQGHSVSGAAVIVAKRYPEAKAEANRTLWRRRTVINK